MTVHPIIFGSTGMVGEGVLHECLNHASVGRVLAVNRRPCGITHEKLTEVLVSDIRHLWTIRAGLEGYNACFFCMGVSSLGMDEDSYRRVTYDRTMHTANTVLLMNPGLVFTYVSGLGTDSTEKGRSMWARVKGRTENHLLRLPFKAAYMFRPGFIQPTEGLRHTYTMYRVLSPVVPALRRLFPSYVVTLREIGLAMINVTLRGYPKRFLECRDIASAAT